MREYFQEYLKNPFCTDLVLLDQISEGMGDISIMEKHYQKACRNFNKNIDFILNANSIY
jgi:hypothetical protein